MNINEIAKLAGVFRATVSRIFISLDILSCRMMKQRQKISASGTWDLTFMHRRHLRMQKAEEY